MVIHLNILSLLLLVQFPLLAAAATPAVDQARWYDIEVIVFSSNAPDEANEYWRKVTVPREVEKAMSPPGGTDDPAVIREAVIEALPEQDYVLLDIHRKLKSSSRYTPLLHLGWRQVVPEREQTLPVRIRYPAADKEAPTTFGRWFGAAPVIEPLQVDGTIAVSLSRYLHADVDLYRYSPAVPGTSAENRDASAVMPSDFVRLSESRRLRSNEIHYFDHPLFGVILQIRPYEKPATPVGADAAPAPPPVSVPVPTAR